MKYLSLACALGFNKDFCMYVLCTKIYLRREHGNFFTRRQTRWECINIITCTNHKRYNLSLPMGLQGGVVHIPF